MTKAYVNEVINPRLGVSLHGDHHNGQGYSILEMTTHLNPPGNATHQRHLQAKSVCVLIKRFVL